MHLPRLLGCCLWLTSVGAQAVNECLSCASASLKGRWVLTQLRSSKTLQFDKFTESEKKCSDATSTNTVNCTGPCMTLMFKDPDQGQGNAEDILYVRGCHSDLTGVTVRDAAELSTDFCEYDGTWNTFRCDGSVATTQANFRLCTGNKCNSQKGIDSTGKCTQSTVGERACFECEKVNGQCKNKNRDPTSRKPKRYCTKTHAKIESTRTYYVTQSNSDINLYYKQSHCSSTRQTTTPIGGLAAARAQITQCICASGDKCNDAASTTMLIAAALPVLALILS